MEPNWIGPYVIHEIKSKGTFRLGKKNPKVLKQLISLEAAQCEREWKYSAAALYSAKPLTQTPTIIITLTSQTAPPLLTSLTTPLSSPARPYPSPYQPDSISPHQSNHTPSPSPPDRTLPPYQPDYSISPNQSDCTPSPHQPDHTSPPHQLDHTPSPHQADHTSSSHQADHTPLLFSQIAPPLLIS